MVITDQLKVDIAGNKAFITKSRNQAGKKGSSNLRRKALKKVVSGITTLEEIKRVVG